MINENKRAAFLVASNYLVMEAWITDIFYFMFLYLNLFPAALLNVLLVLIVV